MLDDTLVHANIKTTE